MFTAWDVLLNLKSCNELRWFVVCQRGEDFCSVHCVPDQMAFAYGHS